MLFSIGLCLIEQMEGLIMNIYLKELKFHRKSLIFWSIGVFLMVASGMVKYAGLSSSGESLTELFAQMPKSVRTVMGVGDLDVSKASGFYGVLYIYLVLMATIHAVMLGASIISKEERDKTSEFLFVKPVSRTKIITAKLLAALTNIVVINLVTFVSSVIIVGKYNKGGSINGDIAVTMIGLFFLQLVFMVIGSAISAMKRRPKTASSQATGILLITFILSIAIDLKESLENLKYLTPFKYFEAKNMLDGGGVDSVYIAISIILTILLTIVTFVFYKKKDLNV
jgi:ABC-2 type transport system permease protein